MAYITVPIDTTPTDLADEAFSYLENQIPGWLPSDGDLDSWLITALAQLAGELRTLAALVPDSIFAYFGESVVGIAPYAPTQATGTTSWTMIDDAGYSVFAGTLIAVTPPASTDTFAFSVLADFAVPAGQTVIRNIAVQAVEAGAAASGITGDVEMIDTYDFVASVTLDAPTSGGVDAESSDAYLQRLSDLFTLLSPRPILPQDFALLAQRSVPAVARAVAIDLYNPGPPVDANCPRCVTVVCVGPDGQPVSPTVKAQVDSLLQAEREVNFLVFVADPTYSTIDVTFQATCYPGFAAAEVEAQAIAAVQDYLNPAKWGVPSFGDPGVRSWINDTTVRYLEVSQVLNDTEGLHYVTSLALGAHGGALGQTDVVMPGVAPLPNAGTITGAVTAES